MPRLWYHAVRGFLALAFLNYGIAKLADIQFNPAYFSSTFDDVPASQLSGFQLTWRFFAHSRAYQCVIGLAELGPAVLLLSSRTATVGALAFFPVILNVVLVDLCFGIHGGATVMALSLLCGDLLLLVADRDRLRRALTTLIRSGGEVPASTPGWRRSLLGYGLALVLTVGVAFLAAQFGGWH